MSAEALAAKAEGNIAFNSENNYEEAIALYQKAVSLCNPEKDALLLSTLHGSISQCFLELGGKAAEAAAAARESLKWDAGNEASKDRLKTATRSGGGGGNDDDDVGQMMGEASKAALEQATKLKEEGNTLFQKKKNRRAALAKYREATDLLSPDTKFVAERNLLSILASNSAAAYLELNDMDGAATSALIALNYNPENDKARVRLGVATGALDPTTLQPFPARQQWAPSPQGTPFFVRLRATLTDAQRAEQPPPVTARTVDLSRFRAEVLPKMIMKNEMKATPFLAPSTPMWLYDLSFLSFAGLDALAGLLRMMGPQQRVSDLRWQALGEECRGPDGKTQAMPWRELLSKFTRCGYVVEQPRGALAKKELVTMNDILAAGLAQNNERFECSALRVVTRCDKCHRIIDLPDPPECAACGTYYCSQSCFDGDRSSHKGQCDAIVENGLIASTVTMHYWVRVANGDVLNPYVK